MKGTGVGDNGRRDSQKFDCATWAQSALTAKGSVQTEESEGINRAGKGPWEIIYFKLYKTQIAVVEQAIQTAALMLGTDKSRGWKIREDLA
jgi:hypothetical protein